MLTAFVVLAIATTGFGLIIYHSYWVPVVLKGNASFGKVAGFISMLGTVFFGCCGLTMSIAWAFTKRSAALSRQVSKILVASTSTRTRIAMTNILGGLGLEAVTCVTKTEGIRLVKAGGMVAVFVDDQPDIIELVGEIRSLAFWRKSRAVHIFVMSVKEEGSFSSRGVTGVISKPLRVERVEKAIEVIQTLS